MKSLFKQVSTIALGALTALGILSAVATPAVADGERFVLISHAPDADSWWNTIKNAIKIAGDQMNVTVEYRNPPTGDLADRRASFSRLRPRIPTALSSPSPISTFFPAR